MIITDAQRKAPKLVALTVIMGFILCTTSATPQCKTIRDNFFETGVLGLPEIYRPDTNIDYLDSNAEYIPITWNAEDGWGGAFWTLPVKSVDGNWNILKTEYIPTPTEAQATRGVSLAMNIGNEPNILYDVSGLVLKKQSFFRKWNQTNWVTVSNYTNSTDLNVSQQSTAASGWGSQISVKLDNEQKPHATWFANITGTCPEGSFDDEVYYRDWNGTDWVTAAGNLTGAELNVSQTCPDEITGDLGALSDDPDLALDSQGTPHIAWNDFGLTSHGGGGWGMISYSKIFYRTWNGSNWVKENGETGTDEIGEGMRPSIVLDNNERPCIAWSWIGVTLTCWDGDSWENNTITGSTEMTAPSLAKKPDGNMAIAWYGYPTDIYYSDYNGTDWLKADGTIGIDTISTDYVTMYTMPEGTAQNVVSLKIRSDGKPAVAWAAASRSTGTGPISPYMLKYKYWDGTNWVTASNNTTKDENITINDTILRFPSLALMSDNTPGIAYSYYNTSENRSMAGYRYWDGNDWEYESPRTMTSIKLDTTPYPLISGKLKVYRTTNEYTDYKYYMKINENDPWTQVNQGEDFNFQTLPALGYTPYWRVEMGTSETKAPDNPIDRAPAAAEIDITYCWEVPPEG